MRKLLLGLGLLLLVGVVPASAQSADKAIPVTGTGPGSYDFTDGAIESGKTVLWENHTDAAHTASGPWGTLSIPAGNGARSQPITITGEPRVINYSCTIHSNMSGQLQVTAATSPPPPPPPPPPAATSPTTARATATTRAGTATTRRATTATTTAGGPVTTIANDFSILAPTTTVESTTTSAPQIAIKEEDDSGGSNTGVIAALAVGLAAILGGGAYALARLRRTP